MPLVDIHLIEGVFDKNQKQAMINKVTNAMVEVEGEAMRGVTWVRVYEVASGEWAIGGKALSAADVKAMQARSWQRNGPDTRRCLNLAFMQHGPQRSWRAASMRSMSFSIIGLVGSGINRAGAQNTIVSPNTDGLRSDRVTCGGLI